jgi:hypothetical protein
MWFEKLMGFKEESYSYVQNNIEVKENKLISKINANEYIYGNLAIPSLGELRIKTNDVPENIKGKISVNEIVSGIYSLHKNPKFKNSVFQVASQFNLLEMASPNITPEDGVGIYEYDNTQGPACAISAGAGTIYRNYFVNINGKVGQRANNQINCIEDFGTFIGNNDNSLWKIKNGYLFAEEKQLIKINEILDSMTEEEIEILKGYLKVGIQEQTEVTITEDKHLVTQVYCSALPINYNACKDKSLWKKFAKIILEATYEATFRAAILNYLKTENNLLFLTLVGGGVFGNDVKWIVDAISKSINLFKDIDLKINIVSYGKSNTNIEKLLTK